MEKGDIVQLFGCGEGHIPTNKPINDKFEILEVYNDDTVKVMSQKEQVKMRVHTSRIVPKKEKKMTETTTETQTEAQVEAQAEAQEPQPKPKPKKPAAKKNKNRQPFDINKWIGECGGGEHWRKNSETFDHKHIKLTSHYVINEDKGFFFTVNTYTYPDKVTTANGVGKYPLKGHSPLIFKSKNGQKIKRRGTKTADELREHIRKRGFKKA